MVYSDDNSYRADTAKQSSGCSNFVVYMVKSTAPQNNYTLNWYTLQKFEWRQHNNGQSN